MEQTLKDWGRAISGNPELQGFRDWLKNKASARTSRHSHLRLTDRNILTTGTEERQSPSDLMCRNEARVP